MREMLRIREGQILHGPLFNEPMRVETVRSGGDGVWIAGLVGVQTERFRNVTLTDQDLERLKIQDPASSYDGTANSSSSVSKPTLWESPTNLIPTSVCRSPASTRCRTS